MHTHEVFNQVPALEDFNLFEIDVPLKEILLRHQSTVDIPGVSEYGALMGSKKWITAGFNANKFPPEFRSHDEKGRRIDEVRFHPSYHELMRMAIQQGLHSQPWTSDSTGSHLTRFAKIYLHTQNEAGTGCPLTMTFSSVPAIKNDFFLSGEWLPKILNKEYDPGNKPYFEKKGLTIGMAMTEKQGGTDVRANTTFARAIDTNDSQKGFTLTGHKWFCSAPMCDAFLTLAQTDKGLTCFLFPRWCPDGEKNRFRIQRLKDKLGNRSNASCEIEFDGAFAWLMGEEGRGISTIIQMVGLSRYDCMIGSSALMRRGVTEVIHHITHRKVSGSYLSDQPLMQRVAADLCVESEAALAMTYRAVQCLESADQEYEQLLWRLMMPLGKYWITKRATVMLAEAMECLGGNGYVEDSILPRLCREAPVNAIWEGSGNVQCLDVLRAIKRSPRVLEVYMDELDAAQGHHKSYDRFISKLKSEIVNSIGEEHEARKLTGTLALAMQAAQLIKLENEVMVDAFCKSRLENNGGWLFGDSSENYEYEKVIKRYQFSV